MMIKKLEHVKRIKMIYEQYPKYSMTGLIILFSNTLITEKSK